MCLQVSDDAHVEIDEQLKLPREYVCQKTYMIAEIGRVRVRGLEADQVLVPPGALWVYGYLIDSLEA
jgi:hypothetical protein